MAEHSIRVLISRDQQVVSDVEVHGTTLLIGSGGHCDVRLGPDLLAIEQVRLTIEEGQVWAETLARTPAVTLLGRPFLSGFVTPTDALSIGPLFVQMASSQGPVLVSKSGHKRFIALAGLLAVLATLAVSAALARTQAGGGFWRAPPQSPFAESAEKGPPPCPERAAASATVAAGDLWREAIDHRERSPFSPQNGLEAVRLFDTAASCFAAGGDKDSSDEARTQGSMLRAQLEKSFHVHRVRLEHSITQQDYRLAKGEVSILKSFLAGREHPYAVWLDNLERWLEVTQGTRQSR